MSYTHGDDWVTSQQSSTTTGAGASVPSALATIGSSTQASSCSMAPSGGPSAPVPFSSYHATEIDEQGYYSAMQQQQHQSSGGASSSSFRGGESGGGGGGGAGEGPGPPLGYHRPSSGSTSTSVYPTTHAPLIHHTLPAMPHNVVYRAYDPLEQYHLPSAAATATPASADDRAGVASVPAGAAARVATVGASSAPSSRASSASHGSTSQLPIGQASNSSQPSMSMHQHYPHFPNPELYPSSSSSHPHPNSHHFPDHDQRQSYYSAYSAAPPSAMVGPGATGSSSGVSNWSSLSPVGDRSYAPLPMSTAAPGFFSDRHVWDLPPIEGGGGQSSRLVAPIARYGSFDEGMLAGPGMPLASGISVPMLSSPRIPTRHRDSTASERSQGSDEERRESTTPFISKLSNLLSNDDHRHLIRWNDEGTKFTFAHSSPELLEVFTRIFRHGNIHSFVRQLNIYSFTRLSTLDLVDALPSDEDPSRASEYHGFMHPLFFRDTPDRICDLTKIKPKMSKKSTAVNKASVAAVGGASGQFPHPGDKRRGSFGGAPSVRDTVSPYAYNPPPSSTTDYYQQRRY